jgi:hypothetical protein
MWWLVVFKARVVYEVYDGGELVRREVSPDPFVRNWVEIVRGLLNPGYVVSLCDASEGGTFQGRIILPANLDLPAPIMNVMGDRGYDHVGIVVGGVKGSKDFNRCTVESKIAHQAGVFEYGVVEDLGFDVVAGNRVWRVRRTFDNVGSSPVDIWESAIISLIAYVKSGETTVSANLVVIALDVRDSAFRLEAGQRGVVTYEFTYFVPSGWTV